MNKSIDEIVEAERTGFRVGYQKGLRDGKSTKLGGLKEIVESLNSKHHDYSDDKIIQADFSQGYNRCKQDLIKTLSNLNQLK